jgi:hypothetical protein
MSQHALRAAPPAGRSLEDGTAIALRLRDCVQRQHSSPRVCLVPIPRACDAQTTPGAVATNTVFEQMLDVKGTATPVTWKIKTLTPPQELVLKGKMKVDMHAWYWPAKVKGARAKPSAAQQQQQRAALRRSKRCDAASRAESIKPPCSPAKRHPALRLRSEGDGQVLRAGRPLRAHLRGALRAPACALLGAKRRKRHQRFRACPHIGNP